MGVGSGGHNKKSIEAHLRRGSFRPGRHAARLTARAPMQAPHVVPMAMPPPVPPELLDGLGTAGAGLVRTLWADYQFTSASSALLRLAGQEVDRLTATRATLAAQPLIVKSRLNPLLIVEQRALRNLLDLFKQMRLESTS